jgi:hypothetical protein
MEAPLLAVLLCAPAAGVPLSASFAGAAHPIAMLCGPERAVVKSKVGLHAGLTAAFRLFQGDGLMTSEALHGLYLGYRQPIVHRGLMRLPDRSSRRLELTEQPGRAFGVDATLYVAPDLGVAASVRYSDVSFFGVTLVNRH